MTVAEYIPLIISTVMALVSVGALLLNFRKSKSDAKESASREKNFDAITDKLRGEIIEQIRDQLGEQNKALIAQNKQLLDDLEKMGVKIKNLETANKEKDERFDKETDRWREGYQRLEKRIRGAEDDLRAEREEKSRLFRELNDTKRLNEQTTRDYIDEIAKLKSNQNIHDKEIKKLQTGQLPSRDELGKSIG